MKLLCLTALILLCGCGPDRPEPQNTNLLTDPIFSERASPVSFAGPRRFAPLPYKVEQLPSIQHVSISHNHYDHLDKHSILSLAGQLAGIQPVVCWRYRLQPH